LNSRVKVSVTCGKVGLLCGRVNGQNLMHRGIAGLHHGFVNWQKKACKPLVLRELGEISEVFRRGQWLRCVKKLEISLKFVFFRLLWPKYLRDKVENLEFSRQV